ncbi:RNA polymerase sigma-70 factor [Chitinophaga sp. XS-30]|nr:RNA polymerase sigma-70 factor [Chitinophaga sp. XS-30]
MIDSVPTNRFAMNVRGEPEDHLLLERMKQGDTAAFALLYDRYWPALWRYAVNAMRDADDAQDVVQDIFTTLWDKRDTLQLHTSLKAYLYRATLNRIINLRNRTKYAEEYIATFKDAFASGDYTTDHAVLVNELMERFEHGLEAMPSKMRTIFEHSRMEYKSHAEISEELGVSRENVKRQIKNALIILKKRMLTLVLCLY